MSKKRFAISDTSAADTGLTFKSNSAQRYKASAGEFKVGDCVVLKSGGPAMTVEDLRGRFAHCTWMVDDEVRLHAFPATCLEKCKWHDERPTTTQPTFERGGLVSKV